MNRTRAFLIRALTLAGGLAAFHVVGVASAVASSGTLYVTNSGNAGAVVPVPLSTLTPGAAITSGVGGFPIAIAIMPDGSLAITANHAGGAHSASVIDTTSHSALEVSAVNFTSPGSVATSPDNSVAYVGNTSGNTIAVFNPRTFQVASSTITVGGEPTGIAFTPDGRFAYVANEASGTVSVVDTSSRTVTATIFATDLPNAACALAVTPDGSKAVVIGGCGVSSGGIAIIDTATNTATVISGGSTDPYEAVAMAPDGTKAYVYDRTTGNVQVVDPRTGSIAATPLVSGQSGIEGLAVSPDGASLFATRSGSGSVSKIDTATGAITPISSVTGTPWADAVTPDQAPTAAFTATTGFSGESTSFDASGSAASPGQTVARYDWDFGDGSGAANGGATPSHTYAVAGTYTVSLTVTDDAGCSTRLVFTGQTASCNGGPAARVSHQVTVTDAPPPPPPPPPPPGTPPNTKIKKAKIRQKKHTATFRFKAIGSATGFQCALKRPARHHSATKPRFKKCASPKAYKHLRKGRYAFKVRALSPTGADPSPAKRKFRIR
jgi:YVTN family beta-propeller protein